MLRKLAPFLAVLVAAPAAAQNLPLVMQPETAVVSPGGVDMVTGMIHDPQARIRRNLGLTQP